MIDYLRFEWRDRPESESTIVSKWRRWMDILAESGIDLSDLTFVSPNGRRIREADLPTVVRRSVLRMPEALGASDAPVHLGGYNSQVAIHSRLGSSERNYLVLSAQREAGNLQARLGQVVLKALLKDSSELWDADHADYFQQTEDPPNASA